MFIKSYQKADVNLSSDVKMELQKMKSINHQNIESLLGVILDQSRISIVTTLASMDSLYDVINQEHRPMPWDVKYSMLQVGSYEG